MKKTLKIICLFRALFSLKMIYLCSPLFGQDIGVDSKQSPIYSFYTFEDVRFSIDADKPLSFSSSLFRVLTTFVPKANYVQLQNKPFLSKIQAPDPTYSTIRGLYYTASLLNSEKQFLKFNSLNDFQPGASLKVGYQYSIKTWGTSKRRPMRRPTTGINLIGQFDNINIYNPEDSTSKRILPLTYGLDGNFNIYPIVRRYIKLVIAFNGSYLHTWNDDDLINYKKIDGSMINNVVAFEEADGRYGVLNKNVETYRLSMSVPIYVWYLNPIVYYSEYLPVNATHYSKIGIFFNIMNKTFDIDDGELPSTVGIGWDFDIKQKNISAPNYFLKGTISFGKL